MINQEIINRFAKGAAPRVLVVTDLSFTKEGNGGFSLARFIETLEQEGAVLGQKPLVTKANIDANDPDSDIKDFKFDNAENGLTRERYDVCFIFAVRSGGSLDLGELDAIAKFMQEGGGMFATGDHAELGAGICRKIIRVQNMRKWTFEQGVPGMSGPTRLSTNLPGDDERYEFDDQSDRHLQRLYLNRRTTAGGWYVPSPPFSPEGWDMPHPIMQAKTSDGTIKAIVHIPDHPHEGECVIPRAEVLQDKNEWPVELGGSEQVIPEIVAKSMSHGGGFFADEVGAYKHPLMPREFIAIAAYDGHRAGVGRVVTDATWHHFIDINIDGTGSGFFTGIPRIALIMPDGKDSPELELLRQHWRNLAEWLIPPQARRRYAAVVHIADAIKSIPLDVLISLSSDFLDELGGEIKGNLDRKLLPYQVNDLIETVIVMGISDPAVRRTADKMVALGAFAAALANQKEEDTDEVILANLAEAVKARLQP